MSDFVLRICDVCKEMNPNHPCAHDECKLLDLLLDQDMAIVVRCRDCKWFVHEVDGTFSCEEWDDMPTVEGGFCHKAKMRGAE